MCEWKKLLRKVSVIRTFIGYQTKTKRVYFTLNISHRLKKEFENCHQISSVLKRTKLWRKYVWSITKVDPVNGLAIRSVFFRFRTPDSEEFWPDSSQFWGLLSHFSPKIWSKAKIFIKAQNFGELRRNRQKSPKKKTALVYHKRPLIYIPEINYRVLNGLVKNYEYCCSSIYLNVLQDLFLGRW